ncbi:class I adenylate-forming enzyme family protein [Rhodococcus opacus]|uniref:class I adenylate-forming enzyme family protein n=1 Tax=Rhodococcus opacus TaxID=37919 RepID=UPI0024B977F1|nr:class I adenylate-forming enzyme family protein [Rhodococcus opacus]MDJ0414326.1 class I adenylate-forming enzyme family protein [Rhodococcus opacus]
MTSFADDTLYMGLTTGPDRHAVADTFGDWTWRELHTQVLGVETYLRGFGLPRRSRVVLLGPDSVWHHILLLACARAEMIFVPVNNRYTAADADHVMRLIKPAVGVLHSDWSSIFAHTGYTRTEDGLGPFDVVTWDTSETNDLSRVETERNPILITLTSGSTAAPKPVLYSSEGETAVSRLHGSLWRLNSRDVLLAPPAFSWIYGLGTANLTGLMSGSQAVMLERFSPTVLCDRAEGRGVTVFMGVVTHFRMLVEYCEKTGRRPFGPELRMAVSGGERRDEVAFAKFEEMFGVPVLDLYASSEGRPGFGYDPFTDPRPVSASCGQVIPGVEVKVDTPSGEELAGELFLRSEGNYMGYFDPDTLVDPEVTPQDWLPMGDRFEIDDAGWGFVVGRSKEVIIRGGANISPVEVEAAIADHPNVTGVAVVGITSASHGESVAAAVVGDFAEPDELDKVLTAYCESRLAKFKIPTEWLVVDRLPRNSNDKVDKIAVKGLFSATV